MIDLWVTLFYLEYASERSNKIKVGGIYQEFLEESTNTVKAKNNLSKSIILATYFIVWIIAMVVFWTMKGNVSDYIFGSLDIILRWIMLPLLLLVLTVMIAKNNYFGRTKWIFAVGAAITFLTVPHTQYIVMAEKELSYYIFKFPNIPYMVVGIVVAICGLSVGTLWRNSLQRMEAIKETFDHRGTSLHTTLKTQ